jgi:thioredoxin-like negative regulator of GroEL
MATVVHEREQPGGDTGAPGLVFFHSELSGRCRRVEGYIAQVLQRRQNHETFRLYRVSEEEQPELFSRFEIETIPTLVVIKDKSVQGRLESPKSCREIERLLGPWLR